MKRLTLFLALVAALLVNVAPAQAGGCVLRQPGATDVMNCGPAQFDSITTAGTLTTTGTLSAEQVTSTDDATITDDLTVGGELVYGGVSMPGDVTIAAAAGGANVSEVTFTVTDIAGTTVASTQNLTVWLSDAATCAGLTGTSASGTVQAKSASGADLGTLTAKKALIVQTLATGVYILEITDTAKTGFYPCVQNPFTGQTVIGTQLVTGDYGS